MTYTYPLISVVIPTCNRAHLLERAVHSVLQQSYTKLEIVIVDDASQDDTEQVSLHFNDTRIRYTRHLSNQGGSAARNTGIQAGRGKFVAFLDDDDEWLPDKLTLQMQAIQDHESTGPTIIYTGLQYITPEGKTERIVRPQKQGYILPDLLFGNYVGSTSTVLAPKAALQAVGSFDTAQKSCQDWDLWIRLAKRCTFIAIHEPLVKHCISAQRIDTNLSAQVQGRLRLLEKIQPQLGKMPSWQRRRVLTNHYMQLAGRYAVHKNYKEARGWLLRACTQNPLNLRVWYQMARIVVTL